MARNKKTKDTAPASAVNASAAVQEAPRRMERPAYIDGPPVDEQGRVIKAPAPPNDGQMELGAKGEECKRWGPPYKAFLTTATFEMGENRRFKQRVFMFKEKPSEQVLATLKENGFTYRPNEKAWTIEANADTRRLCDELAREFAGQAAGRGR